jgi:hypothetical protein
LLRYTAASLEAPGRLFQAFQVSRTRNQLCLRADRNPSGGLPHLLDVHFDSVQYYCGPFVLHGLSLRRATADQQARLVDVHGLDTDPQLGLFLLSAEHDWFIVSGSPQWAEADLPYDAPSLFWSSTTSATSIGSLQ